MRPAPFIIDIARQNRERMKTCDIRRTRKEKQNFCLDIADKSALGFLFSNIRATDPSHAWENGKATRVEQIKEITMIQANKLPLSIIVLALSNLALVMPVRAVDPSNTFYGTGAGNVTTTGTDDSGFGLNALRNVTSGSTNTATGSSALFSNTTGDRNTANGHGALYSNTTGNNSTASGDSSLYSNTTGGDNTGNGFSTLYSNTSGFRNTANGSAALYANTTGSYNTASGAFTLYLNTTGSNNTATGESALALNTTGIDNTAIGCHSLYPNTTGSANLAAGCYSLYSNTTGTLNTAVGHASLQNNTAGNNNIAIGANSGGLLSTGSNNIDIGSLGVLADANTIRIGTSQSRCFVAGIYGTALTVNTPTQVYIDNNGQLGAKPSSRQFKQDIKPMNNASEGILSLRPVTFHYKSDQANTAQFGLIAEEVEKVNPDLVVRDKEGQTYSVRYDEVNAMLLNEFLKEHATVQELKKEIAALKDGLRKVNAQLELGKTVSQTIANN
jgi:hypothetical protein